MNKPKFWAVEFIERMINVCGFIWEAILQSMTENTSISQLTKDFLKHSEKEKNICYVSMNMPKSFVVCKCNRKKHNRNKDENNIVYICTVSPQTLKKRARNSEIPD